MRHVVSAPLLHRPPAPPPRPFRRRRGFTILEVMIAAAVMAFAIMTSLTVMQRAFASVDTARNLTIAGQIMQSELEKMRLRDWSVINAYPSAETQLTLDTAFSSNAFIGNRFRLYRTSTSIDLGTGVPMREVKFTCRWTNYDGRALERSYITYYGQNGLYDFFYNSL